MTLRLTIPLMAYAELVTTFQSTIISTVILSITIYYTPPPFEVFLKTNLGETTFPVIVHLVEICMLVECSSPSLSSSNSFSCNPIQAIRGFSGVTIH
ncbi:MAG: hypothetical protein EZS28_030804 [Streblomastix strix]|uniref:Uncharacterized protein n=1 Tax=Streblomastix strix TaxID=222440 RepID=A0A5J4UTF2_9EUKA|nr:MAG: hypothetical protein EZS28_030804 [Streblomastix strix]